MKNQLVKTNIMIKKLINSGFLPFISVMGTVSIFVLIILFNL